MTRDWHVTPVGDLVDHSSSGRECVCQPSYYFFCDCEETCWKCDEDGKIETTIDYPEPVMIVHNAFDGRD